MEEEYEQDVQMIDENSMTNTFNQTKLEAYKNFIRPEYKIDKQEDLIVMGIDVISSVKSIKQNGTSVNKPYVKIYAINKEGNSIQVSVHSFIPYFYTSYPKQLQNNPKNIEDIRLAINKLFRQREISKHSEKFFQNNVLEDNAISSIEVVNRINIKGYIPKQRQGDYLYLKINTITPNVVSPLRKIFEDESRILNLNLPRQTFQSNIPYALRFMVDKDIVGMGWFKIKGGTYRIKQQKETVCQLQIQCGADSIETIKAEGQWSRIAPIRILSFDIQCGAQHGFPNAAKDPIIQIACVCKTSTEKQQDFKVVFALDGCSPISGVSVVEAKDQKILLEQFQKLILSYDPDMIIGYNIINFDLSYILERASYLKMKNYGHFGRSLHSISKIKKSSFQSKVMGNRQTKDINIDGRVQFDLLIHMHREIKLSSYTLNNVSYHFLKDQKQDVHHSQIYKLFKQGNQTRKRLAIYCLKDAELPLKLMQKLCCLYNYSQMARVTGVTINYLLNRGQQIKVVSQLLRKAKLRKYILPTNRVSKNSDEKGFDGAYVLDPVVGFYEQPIATLDFASLYPSIMMAHNLCYTTLVKAHQLEQYGLSKQDVQLTPQNFYFVINRQKRQGLLPQILNQLITARKQAKKQLKVETDEMMRAVLDGRQLALKISANSVYGFTGATVGQLPCLEISASVTAFGRTMIEKTKQRVLELYPGSQVIYGDTDSVMVKFKLFQSQYQKREDQIRQSMKFGNQAALQISKQFKSPIKLQFEKVYCPYLLMKKKRYAGVYYTTPEKYDKIDKKGFESVRRDNCYLIREILDHTLDLLLCKNDINGITEYIKAKISDLVQNRIDISKLVITKSLSKNTQEEDEDQEKDKGKGKASGKSGKNTYKVRQAHVQLAQKMQKRDQNISLNIGDRISYVMISGFKGSKNYENGEDPIRVLEQDLPIDYDYYIQKQIKPPLERLLKKTDIIPNLQALFVGEHTKNRYMAKINKKTQLGKFVKIFSSCTNCPSKTDEPLCERCEPKSIQIFLNKQMQYEKHQRQFQQLWRECQNCQGSIFMEVLCQNNDCPIYYKRIKVKNDLDAKRKQVSKIETLAFKF